MSIVYKKGIVCVTCGSNEIKVEHGAHSLLYCTCESCHNKFVAQTDESDIIDKYIVERSKVYAAMESDGYKNVRSSTVRDRLRDLAEQYPAVAEIDPIYHWYKIAMVTGNFKNTDVKSKNDVDGCREAESEYLNIDHNNFYIIDQQDVYRHQNYSAQYESYVAAMSAGHDIVQTKKRKKKKAVIISCVSVLAAAVVGVGIFGLVYKPTATSGNVSVEMTNSAFGIFGKFGTELQAAELDAADKEYDVVAGALENTSTKYKAYNLIFVNGNKTVHPDDELAITMAVDSSLYADRIAVYSIGANGESARIDCEVSADKKSLSFSANDGLIAVVENPYIYRFEADNGSVDADVVYYYHGDKTGMPTEPNKYGYSFSGWYDGAKEWTAGAVVNSDKTITAKWTPNSHKINMYADGELLKSMDVTFNEAYALPEYENGKYTPVWYNGETVFAASGVFDVDSDVRLDVKWSKDVAVKYGNSAEDGKLAVVYGQKPSDIKVPTRFGYVFDGYYTKENGGGTKYFDKSGECLAAWNEDDADALYAFWQRDPKYAGYTYITDIDGLRAIDNDPNGKYLLVNDIYIEGSWAPLKQFSGIFDGGGHSIYGFNLDTGLFYEGRTFSFGFISALASDGIIRNLQIGNPNVLTKAFAADIGGEAYNIGMICGISAGTIENCRVINCQMAGTAHGQADEYRYSEFWCNIGGICGGTMDVGAKIIGCYVENCDINSYAWARYNKISPMSRAAGIMAWVSGAEITDCYVKNCKLVSRAVADKGNIFYNTGSPNARSAGIAGECYDSLLTRCVVENNTSEASFERLNQYCDAGSAYKGNVIGFSSSVTVESIFTVAPSGLNCSGSDSALVQTVLTDSSYDAFVAALKNGAESDASRWIKSADGKIALSFEPIDRQVNG